MMLYKLSIQNIRKSFKDYAIYFITLILGVCIFYVFNSLDSQSAMLKVSSRTGKMIELMQELLSYVSVFVSFILGFLIIYASRFLIKKRNKEFGTYMILGMSKKKISMLLLIETFLIGVISLIVGLGLGIIVSQVTSIFIANMFEADMTKFTFNYSIAATIKTIIYFSIIYLIVMLFNTVIINKNKLIDLLQASKKTEKVRLKNPILCLILFVISIAMLGIAYYMVTDGFSELVNYDMQILLVPISLGALGTFLFYFSVSGILLKILSKCKGIYYKNLNTFVFKQISSKINTMVGSVTVICIMLFITLCMLSSAFTIRNYFNNFINKYAPTDFEICQYYGTENKYSKQEFLDLIYKNELLKNNVKDVTFATEYYDDNFLYGDSLGKYYDEIKERYPNVMYDAKVEIVSLSDYKKMAKVYNLEDINLKEDEYAIVANYEKDLYEEVIKRDSELSIFGKKLKPCSSKVVDGFMIIGGNPTNLGFFVVNDDVIQKGEDTNYIIAGNYVKKDKEFSLKMDEELYKYDEKTGISVNTKNDIKECCVGLSAIVTFIGLYLGIIFLISSSAILALKELSDSITDKEKYKTLRQIGADESIINRALFKQTLIFFMMPLVLAVIHTIFGLKFCVIILKTMGVENLLDGSIFTFIFLLAIYGIYFVITYLCSKNIIKDKN